MVMIDEAKAVEKVEKMYEEQKKEINQLKKQQRKAKREKDIVMFMAALGLMGLFCLALCPLYFIHVPKDSFLQLVPWAIYMFILLPIFGWLLILIDKYFEK